MDLESDGLVSQDESLKMGDLADAFTTAKAHQQSLDSQVRDFTTSIENVMDQVHGHWATSSVTTLLCH